MKIALIGYGKMGRAVHEIARERGHECSLIYHPDADVCIDFTEPGAVRGTLELLTPAKTPWVLGTTGWSQEEVLPLVREREIPLLYGPNFSFGIALFRRLVRTSAALMGERYRVSGTEIHHTEKKDAPSGTALKLMEDISGLSFDSIRENGEVGTHQITFDSEEDQIELTHQAKSRMGYAKGAVLAAEWLAEKEGVFTFDDYIEEAMQGCLKASSPL